MHSDTTMEPTPDEMALLCPMNNDTIEGFTFPIAAKCCDAY